MGFNYADIMRQAKMMQKQLQSIQEELKKMEFEATSGGGAVKVKVNGDQEVTEIKINREMVEVEDLEMIEDTVMVAVNDALRQSKEEARSRMASLTGGLNIPGI